MSDNTIRPAARIGKTQWRKWNDAQRSLFNALCAQGRPVGAAINAVNEATMEAEEAPEVVEAKEESGIELDLTMEGVVEATPETRARRPRAAKKKEG